MVDIDEILAEAIRNVWLQGDGPVEVEAARHIRAALERKGIIITPLRPMPEAAPAAPSTQASASAPVA